MIFVTLGSQKFQFNRLLRELDNLIETKKVKDEIFAQIGDSDYKPKNFKYKEFVDRDEFKTIMEKSSIVISHGGTGAIITALKKKKKVIAVPRLSKYGEHVDDHQLQIVSQFENAGIIKSVYDIKELENVLNEIEKVEFKQYISNTHILIEDIEQFIRNTESVHEK